ncbi:uncharacterized protein CANTADRAFT_27333, partial [Suhomyces tanzawaensis NRRL Y-17324]
MFDPTSDTNQINDFSDSNIHNPAAQDQSQVAPATGGYFLEEPNFDEAFLNQNSSYMANTPTMNPANYSTANYVNAGQSYYGGQQLNQNLAEPQFDAYSTNSSTSANTNTINSVSTNTTGQYSNQYQDASMLFFDNQAFGYNNNNVQTNNNNSGNYYSSPQVSQYSSAVPPVNFDLSQPQQINYNYTSNSYEHNGSLENPTAKSTPSIQSPHKYIKEEYEPHRYIKEEYEPLPFSALEIAAASHAEKPKRRYRVIRGISAGGCTTKPPKESVDSDSKFYPVELQINGASVEDVCYSQWNIPEKQDRRRIVRIERIQQGNKLIANFSIVGSADENPVTMPPPRNVDVVEVSCLECDIRINDEYDSSSDDENKGSKSPKNYVKHEVDGGCYQYYITSVEVVEIVELLIGTELVDPAERRRERGRVRSNLVPFWSKKPISSRMSDSTSTSSSNSNTPNQFNAHPTNQDFRVELARRIMGYEIRKPRGFDKEVRILRWDKLVPALKRALQSYYTEIP